MSSQPPAQPSQEEIYKEYLNYDWNSFTDFQVGLEQILDNYLQNLKEQDPSATSIPALDKQQLVDQAKSFFYCSHTGNILNLDDFRQWKAINGDKYDKNKKITEIHEDEPPKNETESSNSAEPPYSSNYQELVELIVSGKPVPGIKEIPDTVLSEKSSHAEAKQRVKPWEKNQEKPDTSFLDG
ncbi:uncharacterized protein RJT20DRAFT_53728 [Scheffersomyces xylosifermentans]|uniref:uncharacterized protein n=1 Tax=Scheffersomyces xylosifermentans TaxID=1304137 RepID=UPI00315C8AE5